MIAIIDYGLGNLKAFENIYKKLDVEYCIARSNEDLKSADRFILPGVGAFDSAMKKFECSGLRQELTSQVFDKKKPVLGICVGMQMLASGSEEGTEKGLGWIDGYVRRIDSTTIPYRTKLPHMGWNDVFTLRQSQLLSGLPQKTQFYFLHSYHFECSDYSNVIATAKYGVDIASVVGKDNIYGIQCHPEKSHGAGISFLKNFSEL